MCFSLKVSLFSCTGHVRVMADVSLLQEALRTMEVYQRDFEELIKRIKTQEAFECADHSNK